MDGVGLSDLPNSIDPNPPNISNGLLLRLLSSFVLGDDDGGMLENRLLELPLSGGDVVDDVILYNELFE